MHLTAVDWSILGLISVRPGHPGVLAAQRTKSGNDFFLAGRSIPAWVASLTYLANLGAQEVIGMGSLRRKYGIATAHAHQVKPYRPLVFVGVFMMPFYYGSKAAQPEYLRMRFDEKTRGDEGQAHYPGRDPIGPWKKSLPALGTARQPSRTNAESLGMDSRLSSNA